MTAVDRIITQLHDARRVRDGVWLAKCPAHDDRRPSLSITAEEDRVLLHCFAGCLIESIVRALSLTLGDLFDNAQSGPSYRSKHIPKRDPLYWSAVRGLEDWADRRLVFVCECLRDIDEHLSIYVRVFRDLHLSEESADLLAKLYHLRSDLEFEFEILNGPYLQPKLDLWRRCV